MSSIARRVRLWRWRRNGRQLASLLFFSAILHGVPAEPPSISRMLGERWATAEFVYESVRRSGLVPWLESRFPK